MPKKCALCGAPYVPNNNNQIYCSPECKTLARKFRQSEAFLEKPKMTTREEIETVEKHCKHPKCCHRGKLGHSQCCDYLYHTGEIRPKKISKCPGYTKMILKVTPDGRIVDKFKTIKLAGDDADMSEASMKQYLGQGKKKLLNGHIYKYESFIDHSKFFSVDTSH